MKKNRESAVYHYLRTPEKQYLLKQEESYTLGRGSDCDIVLPDLTVSRFHARMEWEKGAFVIYDNNSSNGISLNGNKITSAALKSTDRISLGKTQLQYLITRGDSVNEPLQPDDSLIIENRIQDLFEDVEDPGLKDRFHEIIDLYNRKKDRLNHLAFRDTLTGLLNRRSFDKQISDEWKRRRRYGRPLSLIMIDIDHFKKVNDTHGHQKGDSVLEAVAGIILDNVRSSDYPCRYGGEEMAVILPETTLDHAMKTSEKLRKLVEKEVKAREGISVTISIGVSTYQEKMKNPGDLVKAADKALYKAKEEGRNRVIRG